MVMALHKAGIRVILDVVYNHTFDINGSNFQRAFPDYFYRKKTSGEWSDGSGCGNETASERPMMRRFMIESVKYWIQEYHIDGFRFDLMGIHDITTMNEIRQEVDKIDPSIFIYGEGWSAGQCAYPEKKLAMKANTGKLDGIAAFSDDMRDALRGPFSDDTKGAFLAGIPGEEESLKFGLAGAVKHPQVDMGKVNYSRKPWAKQPTQMIAYVSCHDDMCLVDRLKTSMPGIGEDELIRLDLLAQTAVMTSQGVAFMLSGEEMLRDKKGVHNSYNSPDSVNVLPWKNIYKYPQVMDYYSNLISLRKEHPAFTLGDAAQIRRHLDFIHTSDNLVAFRIGEHAGGDSWKNIIVVLNSNKTPKDISVPAAIYTIVCENGKIDKNGIRQQTVGEASSKIKVPAQSALIMHD
jgi:pullulanase